jgi:transcriptional regulator with XRE-family HTH domain
MKPFNVFVRERREALKLNQGDIAGFGQSYIADIEAGRARPSTLKTVKKLAQALQLDMSEKGLEWLWMYSLLNKDPYEAFQRASVARTQGNHYIADGSAVYQASDEISLQPGDSEQAVALKMGPPTRKVRIPGQVKWIYEAEGLHVTFTEGKVVDVVFK